MFGLFCVMLSGYVGWFVWALRLCAVVWVVLGRVFTFVFLFRVLCG